ncbi:hypothetical protein CapIbe_016258 [Capra ibex]
MTLISSLQGKAFNIYNGVLTLSSCIHQVPGQLSSSCDLPSGRQQQETRRWKERQKAKVSYKILELCISGKNNLMNL